MSKRLYIFGNWKMAQSLASAKAFVEGLKSFNREERLQAGIFPSYVHLPLLLEKRSAELWLGGQDCSDEETGAFTGEVSAKSLAELGVESVLIGHSERRQRAHENQSTLMRKLEQAQKAGLLPVFCVGESEAEREEARVFDVLEDQLKALKDANLERLILAYEPVWAIGTGKTPSLTEIEEVQGWLLSRLPGVALLYGGSVKPENASAILRLKAVHGLLIGGASLKKESFESILQCALECLEI